MTIVPSIRLSNWLKLNGFSTAPFMVKELELDNFLEMAKKSHPRKDEIYWNDWALYTIRSRQLYRPPVKLPESITIPPKENNIRDTIWRIIVVFLLSLIAINSFGQVPHDPITLRSDDEGSALSGSTRQSGIYIIDCVGAGITCTWSGSTLDISVGGGGSTHDILSATHTDSTAAAVSRGSIIVGDVTPKWIELIIGANLRVLASDGTDATWIVLTASHIPDARSNL